MSRFARITAPAFTALAIAVALAALTRSEEIPRIVFHSPMDIYYKQAHRFGNEVWPDPDTNYFYYQVRDMGATHVVGYHSRRVLPDSNGTEHRAALETAYLKAWVVPDRVGVAAGDSLDVAAMYMLDLKDEFWDEQGELWPTQDWFQFDQNVGEIVDDQGNEYVVCIPGTDSAGYMFQGDSLNGNVFFYSNRAYSVALELYLDTNDFSNAVVCTLLVADPQLDADTRLTIRTCDVPMNMRNQWVYIAKDWDVGFKARSTTKFSLYWSGTFQVRFRKMHIYDKNYRLLFKDDSAMANWTILRNHLISNYTDLNDVMEGWMVDEPHRPTWDNFSRMRDSIATWMQDSLPNADLQVTAVSLGFGKDLIGAYLAATGVPQVLESGVIPPGARA